MLKNHSENIIAQELSKAFGVVLIVTEMPDHTVRINFNQLTIQKTAIRDKRDFIQFVAKFVSGVISGSVQYQELLKDFEAHKTKSLKETNEHADKIKELEIEIRVLRDLLKKN